MLITTSQPQSGSYVTFAFDKEVLKLINKVASDPIYSIEANWKLVTLVFKQQNGNKKFTSAFRDFVNPKNSKLRSGMMSGDIMELQKIIISKTNRQHLVIYRNEISGASGFDFTLSNSFSAPVSPSNYIVWNNLGSSLSTDSTGGLTSAGINSWGINQIGSSTVSQSSNASNWTYTFNMQLGTPREFSCGTNRTTVNVQNGYSDIDYGFHVNGNGSVDISLLGTYAYASSGVTVGTGTHEFKVVHSGDSVTWYIDGTQVYSVSSFNAYASTHPDSYPIFAFYNGTPQGLSLVSSTKA